MNYPEDTVIDTLDHGSRCRAITAVLKERERQECLKAEGKFPWSCADKYITPSSPYPGFEITSSEKLAVLAEEFGEVSRVVCDSLTHNLDEAALKSELTQVAAVCVAWLEALDNG